MNGFIVFMTLAMGGVFVLMGGAGLITGTIVGVNTDKYTKESVEKLAKPQSILFILMGLTMVGTGLVEMKVLPVNLMTLFVGAIVVIAIADIFFIMTILQKKKRY